jgi:hypothetical protein
MRAHSFEADEPTVPVPKEILNYRVYVLAIVASMGAILFGYDLALIGTSIGLTPFIQQAPPKKPPQTTLSPGAN